MHVLLMLLCRGPSASLGVGGRFGSGYSAQEIIVSRLVYKSLLRESKEMPVLWNPCPEQSWLPQVLAALRLCHAAVPTLVFRV